IENDLIGAQLRKDGIDPANATNAQKTDARNGIALSSYKDGIRKALGLDKSYPAQWFAWARDVIRGDFGVSTFGKRDVGDELKRRIPASFELGLFAMLTSIIVALPIGVISAVRQDSMLDYGTRSFAIAMLALPSFFVATLVIAIAARTFKYSFPIFYKDPW